MKIRSSLSNFIGIKKLNNCINLMFEGRAFGIGNDYRNVVEINIPLSVLNDKSNGIKID